MCIRDSANPGDEAAEARFKEVSAAYDVLGDEERRAEYDQVRAMGPMGGGMPGGGMPGGGFPGGIDLGDLFGGMFGGGRSGSQGRRGADLETRLTLSFLEAVNGVASAGALVSAAGGSAWGGGGGRQDPDPPSPHETFFRVTLAEIG